MPRIAKRCRNAPMLASVLVAGIGVVAAFPAWAAEPMAAAAAQPVVLGADSDPGADAWLAAGANSFTEGQAKARLEQLGYDNVSGLRIDDRGIWRGRATKDGRQVAVALDYRGNAASS